MGVLTTTTARGRLLLIVVILLALGVCGEVGHVDAQLVLNFNQCTGLEPVLSGTVLRRVFKRDQCVH